MTSTIIIVLLFTFGAVIAYAVTFIWRAGRLEHRARHAQWLWNNGLRESAKITDPYLINWLELL